MRVTLPPAVPPDQGGHPKEREIKKTKRKLGKCLCAFMKGETEEEKGFSKLSPAVLWPCICVSIKICSAHKTMEEMAIKNTINGY